MSKVKWASGQSAKLDPNMTDALRARGFQNGEVLSAERLNQTLHDVHSRIEALEVEHAALLDDYNTSQKSYSDLLTSHESKARDPETLRALIQSAWDSLKQLSQRHRHLQEKVDVAALPYAYISLELGGVYREIQDDIEYDIFLDSSLRITEMLFFKSTLRFLPNLFSHIEEAKEYDLILFRTNEPYKRSVSTDYYTQSVAEKRVSDTNKAPRCWFNTISASSALSGLDRGPIPTIIEKDNPFRIVNSSFLSQGPLLELGKENLNALASADPDYFLAAYDHSGKDIVFHTKPNRLSDYIWDSNYSKNDIILCPLYPDYVLGRTLSDLEGTTTKFARDLRVRIHYRGLWEAIRFYTTKLGKPGSDGSYLTTTKKSPRIRFDAFRF